jgi:dihydrofolate reductase
MTNRHWQPSTGWIELDVARLRCLGGFARTVVHARLLGRVLVVQDGLHEERPERREVPILDPRVLLEKGHQFLGVEKHWNRKLEWERYTTSFSGATVLESSRFAPVISGTDGIIEILRSAGFKVEAKQGWRDMRKVTFGGANSLDNYFARPDHAVDWLLWGEEAAAVMADYWKTIDTVLMGRKTYEVAVRSGPGGGGYPGVKTYVFSRTLAEGSHEGVTIIRQEAAEFVRDLKGQDGRDICLMGGGGLARSLFEAGLIDEIGFNIHPVLLGAGIPLFHPMSRQIDLELGECRSFKNGCVYVTYRVKN